MEVLAIIPARGGSKSIPRKNILPLAGRSLLGWTIAAAQAATTVSRVVVSTDDAEIAAETQREGAEVVWRPAEISGDTASSESALLQVLYFLAEQENYHPDLVVFLQCTSPLTLAEDIDHTVELLQQEKADTALTGTAFHYFVWKVDQQGQAEGVNHDKRFRPRRQDREPQYLENGAVYVMKTAGFLEYKHRFFGKTVMSLMPAERCFEIDEPVDFKIAENLLREREIQRQLALLPAEIAALVLDFDGVMTDNMVTVGDDGRESVRCSRGDGMGIAQLKAAGIPVFVLSSEYNPVVTKRCEKLHVPCIQQVENKVTTLLQLLKEQQLPAAATVFVGNDINDLDCLAAVGCGVAVRDAQEQVFHQARIVLSRNGGAGAVREICDLILQKTGKKKS